MAPMVRPSQGGSENPPSNNLWIGNIACDVSDSELKSLLENHGKVDSITSYPSRNYAFVYFKDIDGAKAAKLNLQGHVLHNMPLKIEFAKPAKPCKSLWVAGISPSLPKEEVEKEFRKFGNIQEFKFLRDRTNAYVDYERLEDATQALKSMHGRRLGGGQLRVDFLRSNTNRREQGSEAKDGQFFGRDMVPTDFRWMGQDPLSHRAGPGLSGSKRQHQSLSTHLSRVLSISHPPSVIIEKDMLHNAMILFGEIERIMTFPERNYALVEFRSAEEANRAKEGLQGKLFNDPRITIEFSGSEFPGQPEQMGILGRGRNGMQGNNSTSLQALGIRGPPMGLRTAFEGAPHGSEFSPQSRIGGPSWRRSSPSNGMGSPSSAAWDAYGPSQLNRDSKRSRYDSTMPLDRRDGFNEQYGLSSPSTFGASGSATRATTERDCIWRGLITKGGVPVCRARCVPFGEGINFDLPNPVDISAKTGLEALTTHYEKATGFHLVFFLPDSEADFQSYTELLLFLGSKNRAGVVKFNDGSNLFLVPPDFLTDVLRVSGPERLYGVVLKFPEVTPSVIPANAQSVHPEHAENRWASSQTGYSSVHQEHRTMPRYNTRVSHEDPIPSSKAPALPVSQPAVTLTPELIASLTSLLPAKTGSPGLQMPVLPQAPPVPGPPAAGHETDIQQWNRGYQSSSQLGHVPQAQSQGLPDVQSLMGHIYQPVSPYSQTHGRSTNLSQGAVPMQSGPMVASENTSQQYQQGNNSHGVYGGQGTDHWQDSSRYYNPSMAQEQAYVVASNQAYGSGGSQLQSYTPMPADQPNSHQSEQLQSGTPYGAVQESAEIEADKNERYKSTLLLAANLLSRLHQPSGNQQGQGGSGH